MKLNVEDNMKGISPLLASVLLIAFTLAVATIVGSWLTTMTKTTSETVGAGMAAQANCSKSLLDIVDVSCHSNTNVTVAVQNAGSITLISPSFYFKTTDETTCTNSATATLSGGQISTFEINCSNFAVNKTLNFVRVTALCQGDVSVYMEKKDFSNFCS